MNKLYFILLLMPISVISQNLEFLPVSNNSTDGSSLVHVANTDNGIRVFTKEEQTIGRLSKTGPEETNFHLFHVMDYDQSGKMIEKKKYILYKSEFPTSRDYSFKKGRITYGSNKDVINYEQLVSKYPSLNEVESIDYENRKLPQEYYDNKLRTNFSGRILGLKINKFKKKPKVEKEESKGIKVDIGGLGKMLSGEGSQYEKIESEFLDWEDSYKDAQKKSFWIGRYSVPCQKTGKVLAYQVYKNDEDNFHVYSQKEFVLYDNDGTILKTTDRSTDVKWVIDKYAADVKHKDGVGALNSVSIAELEVYHKKKNPTANKNTIRVQNFGINGDLNYEHIVEMPLDLSRLDTLVLTPSGKTIIAGYMKKGSNFVVTCDNKSSTITIMGGDKDYYGDPTNLISTNQGDFASYIYGNKFYLFPLSEGKVDPQTVQAQSKEIIASGIDYFETDQALLFAFKDSSSGINNFKWPMTHVQLMKYEDNKLRPISNFEEDQFVLDNSKAKFDSKFVELDDNIYMLGRIFKLDEDGDLLNGNMLAKIKL